jgi:hypothetical protein
MSISGNLVDVSVADVMQFVHLGGRTGTLTIKSPERQAEVGFHRGRIISAWTPESKRLGDLLVDIGEIDENTLMEALARQDREVPKVSLGKILVTMGAVTKDDLREAIADQIEHTVYDLVTWSSGDFDFKLNELRPVDDIAVYPGDILPDINLNTQILVLEALRIFDEKNRDRARSEAEGGAEAAAPETEAVPAPAEAQPESEAVLDRLVSDEQDQLGDELTGPSRGHSLGEQERESKPRFQVVSGDAALIEELRQRIPVQEAVFAEVRLWDSGLTLPGESPPVVLLDLRGGGIEFADFESYCRGRAHASILAIASSPESAARLYESGALAAVPPDAEAIHACLTSVLRSRRGRARIASEQFETNAGFAKLRRVVADLRSGLLSATVALNLMQVISESVERAVMFVVRGDHLMALGAFGDGPEGDSLARATHRLKIPLNSRNALCEAISDGRARSLKFDEADFPAEFIERVGKPRTGQIVLFPVLGSHKVNSVVYTDNGRLSREIEEIEILELAAAQVGVAFENEVLRRKMDRLGDPNEQPNESSMGQVL